jgi:L-ribulose-5-phosphate 3-epimerase
MLGHPQKQGSSRGHTHTEHLRNSYINFTDLVSLTKIIKKQIMNRRHFNKIAALSSLGLASGTIQSQGAAHASKSSKPLSVSVFSKHLQFLNYKETAKIAKEIGFDGVDLTVRPGGHVEPENAKRDLPNAVEAIRSEGLQSAMMTSGVNNADDPVNIQVLNTASEQGIKYYRTSYYRVKGMKLPNWKATLDPFKKQFDALGKLNKKLGLHGAYQNHSGIYVGSYLPDIAYLLEGNDPQWLGCQFDIRHATVEGATAWPLGLEWIKEHISTIVAKDFKWGVKDGALQPVNVPIGQGVVDFVGYFKLLRKYEIQPQVSMHYEYELGGANHGDRELTIPRDQVYEAMIIDLKKLQELWLASA